MLFTINIYYYIMELMKNLIYFIAKQIQFPNVKRYVTDELYSVTPKTLISIFVLASIFLYIFWSEMEKKPLLIGWYLIIMTINSIRFYDYKRYKSSDKSRYSFWYNSFKFKATLNAFLWGLTPILFFPEVGHTHQLILVLFLSGIAGGVTGFIFDFRISSIFITLLLIPLIVMLSFSTIIHAHILQLLLVIFYLLLLIANKHLNQLFYETYTNLERYQWTKDMLSIKEKKLNSLLQQAPIGIFYYDKSLKLLKYNELFYQIFGLEKDLNGFNLKSLKDKKAVEMMEHVLHNNSTKEGLGSYNLSYQKKEIWVELTCSALLDENNDVIGGVGTLEDKTVEHKAYEKINHISHHDALTDLPNRRNYQEYMKELLQNSKHEHYSSILFYMDLNHFKQINDTFGHTIGDKLLLLVSQRLASIKMEGKYLSRIGGDEFVLLIPFCETSPEKIKEKAYNLALDIKKIFNKTFKIEGLELYITASIGIVIIEPKNQNTEQILRQADMAMYQTKREGLNNIQFYDHSLDLKQRELTSLQHDLKLAINNGELELYYQPIVSITDNKLNAIEALIRWNHPTKGLIMPDMFLPMATESGLITKLGWWVAKEACRQLYVWQKSNYSNFEYLSININARQLNEINFAEHLNQCIVKGGIEPSLLKLELTETTLLENFEQTQIIIKKLQEKGIECSIDDFGTGYSSLSYLKKISFRVLKIDKIFTKEIATNRDNEELVKSIIEIGKQFHYKIIVEGVEKEEEREKLISLDKNIYYQGFLCSRAIPAKAFEEKFLKVKE